MKKLTAVLLFGGLSSEHEISCISAGTFVTHLNPEKYNLIKVGITKTGRWLETQATTAQMADGSWETLPDNTPCFISPSRDPQGLVRLTAAGAETVAVDVVLPVLHGLWGEDGTVQGLLELAGIPYVGCGVVGSAVCMDKAVANALFEQAGVPHTRWDWASREELTADREQTVARLEKKLSYPIFVKPANAGSSVGIGKAHDRAELLDAIAVALKEDSKVVFEENIDGQEVECAVLGNDTTFASLPGEIVAGAEFYTYDDKYKNGVSQTLIPARLPQEKLEEVSRLAKLAYRACCCRGLSRCDFFVEKGTGRVLINEINTMPGFTAISMYPKLMEAAGTPTPQLIDKLVELALERTASHG